MNNNTANQPGRIARRLFQWGQTSINGLKLTANWKSTRLLTIIGGALGFIGDFLTPAADIIVGGFALFLVLWLGGIIGLRKNVMSKTWLNPQNCARVTLSGMTGSVIFGVVCLARLATGCDAGLSPCASPEIKELQTTLLNIGSDVSTIKDVTQSIDQRTVEIADDTQQVSRSVRNIENQMDVGVALDILHRAVEAKSGHDQGQIAAIQTLMSAKHSFAGSDLSGVSFAGGDLSGIDMFDANLELSSFKNSKLHGANLADTGLEFADLSQSNANQANFQDTYMPYAVARNARLSGADFRRANAFAVDFHGADLSNARFDGASLVMADLRNADLRGANLTNTVMFGALLSGAIIDENTVFTNTDVGSVVGLKPPTALKGPEVCTRYHPRGGYFDPQIYEEIPSPNSRYGVKLEPIYFFNLNGPAVVGLTHTDNDLCQPIASDEFVSHDPPLANGVFEYKHLSFKLGTALAKAGRRHMMSDRVRSHAKLLANEQHAAQLFRPGTQRLANFVQRIETATKELVAPEYDCMDSDTASLLRTQYGQKSGRSTIYFNAAQLRARNEQEWSRLQGNPLYRGDYLTETIPLGDTTTANATLSWGKMFHDSDNSLDLKGPVEEAIQRWNQERIKALNGKVSLCFGSVETLGSHFRTPGSIALQAAKLPAQQYITTDYNGIWAWKIREQLAPDILEVIIPHLDGGRSWTTFPTDLRIEIDMEINSIQTLEYRRDELLYIVDATVTDQRRRRFSITEPDSKE